MPETAFISYASADRALALRVADLVRSAGLEVWLDQDHMAPGTSVRGGLDDAVRRADHFVVLLTHDALASDWVRFEVDTALAAADNGTLHLVPLRCDDALPPLGLQHLSWGDARTTNHLVRALNLALAAHEERPLSSERIRARFVARMAPRLGLRMIPSQALKGSAGLGPPARAYVFVGDYAEHAGCSLRQILGSLWAGDAYDRVASSDHAWSAVVFDAGPGNARKLDLFPASWKAMYRIVSDRRRLNLLEMAADDRAAFGARPPYEYLSGDQAAWYKRLVEGRPWRVGGQNSAERQDRLRELFGFEWWCYDGSGLTAQRQGGGEGAERPVRLFLVRNLRLADLEARIEPMGRPSDGHVLA